MMRIDRATTGIGSLPHHNVDAALDFSFRAGIPFCPQIPIRNPWEYMVAQALEGMPGLQVDRQGNAELHADIWSSRTSDFDKRLNEAFQARDPAAFLPFEPSPAVSSSWQPFIWELEERGVTTAKIQLAGPMTAQWALKVRNAGPAEKHREITSQIYRLVTARALAMAYRLKATGVQPLLYLDEPGLYGFSKTNPAHLLALQELKILVQALKKEGITVGLHCCGNTDWEAILELGADVLSIDAALSLQSVLETREGAALEAFLMKGGRLSLGVIPTHKTPVLEALDVSGLFEGLIESFGKVWSAKPDLIRKTLAESLYTPACGLALHSIADAETVLETLNEFYGACIAKMR